MGEIIVQDLLKYANVFGLLRIKSQICFFSVSCELWKLTIVLVILGNMCMDPRLTSNELRAEAAGSTDECQVTPVIHVLQYPGCVPKPIPSFACIGRCASYIQVRSNLALRKNIYY